VERLTTDNANERAISVREDDAVKFHGEAGDLLLVYLHSYFISLRQLYCTAVCFHLSVLRCIIGQWSQLQMLI